MNSWSLQGKCKFPSPFFILISSHKGNHMCLSCSTISEIYTYFNWWLIPSTLLCDSHQAATFMSCIFLPNTSPVQNYLHCLCSCSYITSIQNMFHEMAQKWLLLSKNFPQWSLNLISLFVLTTITSPGDYWSFLS